MCRSAFGAPAKNTRPASVCDEHSQFARHQELDGEQNTAEVRHSHTVRCRPQTDFSENRVNGYRIEPIPIKPETAQEKHFHGMERFPRPFFPPTLRASVGRVGTGSSHVSVYRCHLCYQKPTSHSRCPDRPRLKLLTKAPCVGYAGLLRVSYMISPAAPACPKEPVAVYRRDSEN